MDDDRVKKLIEEMENQLNNSDSLDSDYVDKLINSLDEDLKESNEKTFDSKDIKDVSDVKKEIEALSDELFLIAKDREQIVRKYLRLLQKASIRLVKKNQKMMALNSIKNSLQRDLMESISRIKDLEFMLHHRDLELKELRETKSHVESEDLKFYVEELEKLKSNFDEMELERDELLSKISDLESRPVESLLELSDNSKDNIDVESYESKIKDLQMELEKKNAVIELLQRPEYDYKGIVTFDIERVNAKWVGWPEGANLEEIDYVLVNNSSEEIKDLSMDVYLENEQGNSVKIEGLKVKRNLMPKEKISKKLNLFKHLRNRGTYKVEVRLYMDNKQKELAEQTKLLVI